MTLTELAQYMQKLGCVNAMNLDGGGSTVMYVNGYIANKPPVKGGIALSNALTISMHEE
jgi:exopolysaccharide biosynthesis protein